jgi:hypothetical protein
MIARSVTPSPETARRPSLIGAGSVAVNPEPAERPAHKEISNHVDDIEREP